MTFEEFQTTRTFCEDLRSHRSQHIREDFESMSVPVPGFTYEGGSFWVRLVANGVGFCTTCGNTEPVSESLDSVERDLFTYTRGL